MDNAQVHATALERFKVAAQAFTKQRTRELEDLRFAAGEQWPADIKSQRAGGQAFGTMPPIPARPCLTINKLRQPLQQVSNQQRQARLALKFAPKGDGASEDTAAAFEDIARAIQADSRAHLARNWAFDRAVTAGLGWYRILTAWANDKDDELDIVYKRILNQGAVYPDPFAQEPDWSDGEFLFITEWVPWQRYQRDYPNSGIDPDARFSDLIADAGDWFHLGDGTDEGKAVQVAEYFHLQHHVETITLPDGRTRKRDRPTVQWCKLNAVQVLESEDWLGVHIPVIPVIGDEYNLNGERRWEGIVRPAMDAGRSYNYMRSAQVEAVGLAPKAPWMVAEGQIEGYEDWYNQANTRNLPYLPYKPVGLLGAPVPPPQRNVTEPAIQAITLAAHEADGDVKATTGIFDASLGNINPSDRSGKAILALQKQAETGTSGYIGNLADMSMVYEGKILKDLIPKVYDRPGRIVASVGEDDQRKSLMLGTPFVMEGSMPRPAQPGEPGAKTIDLTTGEYSVAVTVGKSFTTRREEGASSMGELISAAPQIAPLVSDLWIGNMDFPGARQIADRLKKMLPPQLQEEGQQNPAQQLAQLQQQMQQLMQVTELQTKELAEKTKVIETDTIKAQAELTRAQLDNATKVKVAEIQSQTQFGVAEIKAALEDYKLRIAHIETILGHQAEAEAGMRGQAHEAAMQGSAQGFEAQQTAQGQQFEGEQAEQDRGLQAGMQDQQLTAQQQQAAMAAESSET